MTVPRFAFLVGQTITNLAITTIINLGILARGYLRVQRIERLRTLGLHYIACCCLTIRSYITNVPATATL